MRAIVELIALGEDREKDEKRQIQATVKPIGRDEFVAAGAAGMKARYMFEVREEEYNDEEELVYNGRRLDIYRTFGPRDDRRVELYAGERVGVK